MPREQPSLVHSPSSRRLQRDGLSDHERTHIGHVGGSGNKTRISGHRFLGKFYPLRVRAISDANKIGMPLNQVTSSNVSSWPTFANEMKTPASDLGRVTNDLAAVVPPVALAVPFSGYVNATNTEQGIIEQLISDLHSEDESALVSADSSVTAEADTAGQHTTALRLALIAYAARYHLKLPGWAHRIGTGKN